MITTYRDSTVTAAERARLIMDMLRQHPGLGALQRDGMKALDSLKAELVQEATQLSEQRLKDIESFIHGEETANATTYRSSDTVPSQPVATPNVPKAGEEGMTSTQGSQSSWVPIVLALTVACAIVAGMLVVVARRRSGGRT
jgi:acid phosphatase family membrane protein YuiD